MSLPFRTGLSRTLATAVAGAIVAVERVEDTIAEAASATVADARLRGWINHGDERVPLALIGGALAAWLIRSEHWALHLYARAMRDAERDAVCWTPLLDRMAVVGLWPSQKGRVVLGGKVTIVTPLPASQVLDPLRRWLRDQTDGAAFAPLAVFHASPVRALVQSRLAVLPAVASFTGEYPSHRVETTPAEQRVTHTAPIELAPRAVAPMVVAPSVVAPSVVAPSVVTQSVVTPSVVTPSVVEPSAAASCVAAPTPGAAVPPLQAALADVAFGPHGVADHAATAHEHAATNTPGHQRSHQAPPRVEPKYTPAQVTGLMAMASKATGWSNEAEVKPEIRRAVNVLIEYRALPSESLYSLYSACRKVKSWVVRIVAHVSATIELWRAALRDNNWLEVRESIVKSRTARRDSVIRLILSRCGSADVLCALCLDGDLPDVPQIARRVLRVDPKGLLGALREAAATTGLRLAASDLLPLVRHEDAEVRQGAVSLLQLMGHHA